MTGTQMAADKEKVAAKMREKQAAGIALLSMKYPLLLLLKHSQPMPKRPPKLPQRNRVFGHGVIRERLNACNDGVLGRAYDLSMGAWFTKGLDCVALEWNSHN